MLQSSASPLKDADLRIEELRRDRLVVCLRKDNAVASKSALQAADLKTNLTIMYHPQRHQPRTLGWWSFWAMLVLHLKSIPVHRIRLKCKRS